jgi:formylglycine-generating enzyme required for sulfatase activity
MFEDYYQTLGVSRDATQEEIKKSYYQLARESHPDLHPDDPAAKQRFKQIQRAFQILGDLEERARYNRQYDSHFHSAPPPPPFKPESSSAATAASQGDPPVSAGGTRKAPRRRRSNSVTTILSVMVGAMLAIPAATLLLWVLGDNVFQLFSGESTTLPQGSNKTSPDKGSTVKPKVARKKEETATEPTVLPPDIAMAPFDSVVARKHQESWAKFLGVPVEFVNPLGMKFRLIPPGEFQMGSPAGEAGRTATEDRHEVVITKPFYISETEVTREQYSRVIGQVATDVASARSPQDDLTWGAAVEFCQKLSAVEHRVFRLPTEAEWEFACRAGTNTAFHFGDRLMAKDANYGAAEQRLKPVASYLANAFGLFDMHGNAAEWCADWFQPDFYRRSPLRDPLGRPPSNSLQVVRGGSYQDPESSCRSAARLGKDDRAGFRVISRIRPNAMFASAISRQNAWGSNAIDCRKIAHRLKAHDSFDASQSWILTMEFNAEKLDGDFQCLLVWGDARAGRDVVCMHLSHNSVNCWICDCYDNSAQYFNFTLPKDSVGRWIPVRLEYDRDAPALRFFVDDKLVRLDEPLIAPRLDRPSPVWVGNVGANNSDERRFRGQIRNFSMANVITVNESAHGQTKESNGSVRDTRESLNESEASRMVESNISPFANKAASETVPNAAAGGMNAGDGLLVSIGGVETGFKWWPAGTYRMGFPRVNEAESRSIKTQMTVCLSSGFWIAEHDTTEVLWRGVMSAASPSFAVRTSRLPMPNIKNVECLEFCRRATQLLQDSNKLGSAGQFFCLRTKKLNKWGVYAVAGNVNE